MDILKNIFKHKVNIQDVFSSLDRFSNDIKSLYDIRNTASAFFGEGWRTNMEMYIASLPQNYRAKYYDIFKQVLEYEHAVSIWTQATQIVNYSRPLTSDVLKNMSEYRRYLLKFGVEGQRLYSRLSSMLDVPVESQQKTISEENVSPAENNVQTELSNSVQKDTLTEKETNIEDISKSDNVSEETAPEKTTTLDENSEYLAQLKSKILQKVREMSSDAEDRAEISQSDNYSEEISDDAEKIEHKEPSLLSSSEAETKSAENANPETTASQDWNLNSFMNFHKFLDLSSSIMPAIVLYKNAPNLEEYPYYGFIIDALDYAIAQGEKILSTSSDSEIRKYFSGGKSELEGILISYRHLRDDQIVVPQKLKTSAVNTEAEDIPYVRPEGS